MFCREENTFSTTAMFANALKIFVNFQSFQNGTRTDIAYPRGLIFVRFYN